MQIQVPVPVHKILEEAAILPLEDQECIVDTLTTRRLHELWRNQIAVRAREAKRNYEMGNVQHGTVEDFMNGLEEDDD